MKLVKFGKTGLTIKIDKNSSGREDVWLLPESIAELFGKDKTVITRHIANLYKNKEVEPDTFKEVLLERKM
jgi:hypothetical protein